MAKEHRMPLSLKFLDLRYSKVSRALPKIYATVTVLLWKSAKFYEKKLDATKERQSMMAEYKPELEKKRLIPLRGPNPLHIFTPTKGQFNFIL